MTNLWQPDAATTNPIGERAFNGSARTMDGHRARCLGNGIVPAVAEAIFKEIRKQIDTHPRNT